MATTAIGNGATDLASILQTAMAGSYVAKGSGQTFTVSQSIVIYVNSTTQGPLGLDLGGGTIISNVSDGSPVIKVVVGPNVDLRYLTFSNFTIEGNGLEGSGIQIVAAANDRWIYNFGVDNVNVTGVGGYGIDVQGSVFEGIISDSWMSNNAKGGAYFSHLADGQASALRWYGGGFEDNGGAGIILDNGVRDMTVDGATFTGNQGGGISAGSGITSVSNSEFIDNQGQGVWFQNYGNFDNNTFASSGGQTVGITGWLNGNATVVDNTSVWTGQGADPTTLANLNGYGGVFASGDTGQILTGSSLSVGTAGGGNFTQVSVSGQGVAEPILQEVTAATVAALPTSSGTGAVEIALEAAVATGHAELTESYYSVGASIVINLTSAHQGPIDIDFGGAKIQSAIVNGGPIIEIIVGPGVHVSQLTLSNLLINGNGGESAGIKIVADGADRSIQNLSINGVNIEHTGGIGLDVIGNVSGTIFNSWMNGNADGGARFANGPSGGVADDLYWIGGGFRKNEVAGLILDNGTCDMTVKSAYFCENVGVGIYATSGITLVKGSGFENNGGTGAVIMGSSSFVDDTFSTWGAQKVAVGGYLSNDQVNMTGVSSEYYGPGADPTLVANLQGSGTLAIAGSGKVIVGPGVSVTGGVATVAIGDPEPATGEPAPVPVPVVTEALVSDTGSSATDKVTSSAALTGTADPSATVKITIDGMQVGTTTADATGKWSYSPTGLSDGQHTVVVSETNAAGTGSATLTFTLDRSAPTVTSKLASDTGASATDKVTSSATITGTAAPSSTVKFTIDGTAVAATATADASGNWSFTPTGLANGQHTIVVSQTDLAGNIGSSSLTFTLDTVAGAVTSRLANDTGSSGTDKVTSSAAISGTAPPGAAIKFTVDGAPVTATATADASGNWSFIPAGLADGRHTVVASQTDLAGNTSSGTLTFTLDTTAPVVTAATAASTADARATATTEAAPAISGTADANSTIRLTVDGTAITATATADASGNWSYTPTGLSAGAHTIVASQSDMAGNTGSASVDFTAVDGSLGGSGESPAVLAFTGGSYTNGQLTVTGTTPAANSTVWIYDGSTWAGAVTSDANGNFSFTAAAAAGSVHSFGAIAIDPAGNSTKTETPYEYTAAASSTSEPPLPAIELPVVTGKLLSDTGALANDRITSEAALTGTADPHAVVHFTIDGTAVAATATADATGRWSFTPTDLSDGYHAVVASVTNAAGDTGAATFSFVYSAHAPQPVFLGETLSNGKVTIMGSTGTAGDQVSIYDGNSRLGLATTGANGAFSFTTDASDSVHSYDANATGPTGEGKAIGKALLGSSAADALVGTSGHDVIVGNGGNDAITGGLGADRLSGGGGNDTFVYTDAAQSAAAGGDKITDFQHGLDKIDFTAIEGIAASNGTPAFQGYLSGSGTQTLNAHSVAVMEVGGNTEVLVNTSDAAQTVSATDMHAADMKITLVGVNLGVAGSDFHHN